MIYSKKSNIINLICKLILLVILLYSITLSKIYAQDSTKIYETQYKQLTISWDTYLFNNDSIGKIITRLENFAIKSKNDTLLADVYAKYVHYYQHTDYEPHLVVHYNTKLIVLCNRLNVECYTKPYENMSLGNVYYNFGLYRQAVKIYKNELLLTESKTKDDLRFSIAYNNIGMCFRELNEQDSATMNFYKSIHIRKEINPVLVAHSYIFLASLSSTMKNYRKTQNYCDTIGVYLNLYNKKQYSKNEFDESYYQTVYNDVMLSFYQLQAKLFRAQQNNDSAIVYLDRALLITYDDKQIADINSQKAEIFYAAGDYMNARKCINLAIETYENCKYYNRLSELYLIAIRISKNTNNNTSLQQYQNRFIEIQDSATNNILSKNALKEQLQFEISRSEQNISRIEKELIQENTISSFRYKLIVLLSVFSVILMGLIIFLIKIRKTQRQLNKELKNKNQHLIENKAKLEAAEQKIEAEREKLFTILENIPAFVCLQDMNYKLSYVNQKFKQTFGEPDGQTCYQFLRNNQTKCENCPTYDNCNGITAHGCEWKDSTGNIFVLFDNSFVTIDNEKMILKLGVDISDRKKAEIALAESEQRFKQILNAFDDPIYISKPNYKIVYYNKAMEKLIGKDKIGSKCYESIYKSHEICQWCQYQNLLETRSFIAYDIKVPNTEKYRYVRNIIFANNQKLTIYQDVTQRKQIENQLRELNATKDKLFSIIAHDLKNPFNTILGFAELLQKKIDQPDRVKKFSESILTSAKSAFTLLENLLTWARSQKGSIQFKPENIRLSSIVQDISELLRNQYELKHITFISNISHDIFIFADYNMISTIIRNLFTNAIKYTNINGTIRISATQNSGTIEISIMDNGIGMSGTIVKQLFKIEHKISQPGTNNEKGTGLGLILCREFVDKHGGKIWVESELDKGSVFKFTLPLTKEK